MVNVGKYTIHGFYGISALLYSNPLELRQYHGRKNPKEYRVKNSIQTEALEMSMSTSFVSISCTLGVQRPLIQWSVRKDHCFTRDLQSTIPGDYYFILF